MVGRKYNGNGSGIQLPGEPVYNIVGGVLARVDPKNPKSITYAETAIQHALEERRIRFEEAERGRLLIEQARR